MKVHPEARRTTPRFEGAGPASSRETQRPALSPTKNPIRALDRLFYHDMADLVRSLRGWADGMTREPGPSKERGRCLMNLTDLLDRELRSHQAVGDWGLPHVASRTVSSKGLLEEVRDVLQGHPAGAGRGIDLRCEEDRGFDTDPDLLFRVLLNMSINALEATPPGQSITLESRWLGGEILLAVHNPGAIPPGLRASIFKRSFTTKEGLERGLGTYGIKLLGEVVLGGRVGFESGPETTRFWIRLPLHPRGASH